VKDTFVSVKGSAAAYSGPVPTRRRPSRSAWGAKVFGTYPFSGAAYVGGGIGGYGIESHDVQFTAWGECRLAPDGSRALRDWALRAHDGRLRARR
jgi:hypothetical protein